MVFLFGVDVPLMELFSVYIFLILFALIILLIEIARLRKLITLLSGVTHNNQGVIERLDDQLVKSKSKPKVK